MIPNTTAAAMRCAVIGGGAWGTAIADRLARNGHDTVLWAREKDVVAALKAYDAARVGPASKVVLTNRSNPPDFINIKVEELVGDKPFDNLDKYITQDELRTLSDNYKKVAGFSLAPAN